MNEEIYNFLSELNEDIEWSSYFYKSNLVDEIVKDFTFTKRRYYDLQKRSGKSFLLTMLAIIQAWLQDNEKPIVVFSQNLWQAHRLMKYSCKHLEMLQNVLGIRIECLTSTCKLQLKNSKQKNITISFWSTLSDPSVVFIDEYTHYRGLSELCTIYSKCDLFAIGTSETFFNENIQEVKLIS